METPIEVDFHTYVSQELCKFMYPMFW